MLAKLTLLTVNLILACAAGETPRPACSAENRGRLWPESAAERSRTAVELCTKHLFRYRWVKLTVSVADLRATRQPAAGAPAPGFAARP